MNEKKGLSLKYFILLIAVVFFLSVIGGTYAYFMLTQTDDEAIAGDAASVSLALAVERKLPVSGSYPLVPQNSGVSLENAMKAGCVDTQPNGVCQLYEISITNNSSISVVLDGGISFRSGDSELTIEEAIPNFKWMLVSSYDDTDITQSVLGNGTIHDATTAKTSFYSNVSLDANDTATFYVILWVNEIGEEQEGYSQSFFGDVSFVSTGGTGITATFT